MGSLVLASLCGFTYGWHHHSINPPFVITRKTEEPPEVKLLRKEGTYEAIRQGQSKKVSNLGLKEFEKRSRPGAIRHPRDAAQPAALEK
jgi:hypothetical protein